MSKQLRGMLTASGGCSTARNISRATWARNWQLSLLVPKARRRLRKASRFFLCRLKPKIGTRSVPTGEVELRDSEAYLLGKTEWGIYLILESLNLSRVGNIVGSVALAQRALADALTFAEQRVAF